MVKGYLSTKDLMARYRCSPVTIFRWRKRENNPLPQPRFVAVGSPNLYAIDDIEAWEEARHDESRAAIEATLEA